MKGVMVFGGICRNPGPSLRGFVGCEGRRLESRSSPGSTKVPVAIAIEIPGGMVKCSWCDEICLKLYQPCGELAGLEQGSFALVKFWSKRQKSCVESRKSD
jgi:hypothetical protein